MLIVINYCVLSLEEGVGKLRLRCPHKTQIPEVITYPVEEEGNYEQLIIRLLFRVWGLVC